MRTAYRTLLALLLTAGLTACGSSDNSTPTPGDDAGDTSGGDVQTDTGEPDVVDDTGEDADTGEPDVIEDTGDDTDAGEDIDTGDDTDAGDDTDVEADTDAGDDTDTGEDVRPPNCGDGVVDDDEECDDGNDDDADTCTTFCTIAECGDGFVGLQRGPVVEAAPVVENPFGVSGPVCDVGATCAGGTCDVSDDPTAPEHGICQALGHFQAISVTYGGDVGADADPAVRANNWGCFDYECGEGPSENSDGACGAGRMLVEIVCDGWVEEPCDEGDNGNGPNQCRPGCELPACGDGVTDDAFGEDCDDANDVPDDGCNLCLFPQCGDGLVQAGEECDDGNDADDDSCRSDCTLPVCGDGIIQPGEECDDGDANSEAPDACRPVTCQLAGCGDLVLDTGEECDDGNDVNEDGCSNNCLTPQCGDGITQVDDPFNEECDDGNDEPLDACDNECVAAVCGDGIVQAAGPAIDVTYSFADGIPAEFEVGPNTWELVEDATRGQVLQSTDIDDNGTVGFSIDVVFESDTEVSFGYRVDSEACCDDLNFYANGSLVSRYVGAPDWDEASELIEAGSYTLLWTYEKDGSVSSGTDNAAIDQISFLGIPVISEQCDDGELNADEPDACRASTCQLPACLDGIVDTGEECDDGNTVDTDGCSNACTLPVCGDGVLQLPNNEVCDDGNTEIGEGDDCAADCTFATCGDGFINTSFRPVTIENPRVPDGFSDLGSLCAIEDSCAAGETCDLTFVPDAPEHGACQDLGFDRAVSVRYLEPQDGDEGTTVDNWSCDAYVCTTGFIFLGPCEFGVAAELTCGFFEEDECDDGNDVDGDGCSNLCRTPRCGDGFVDVEGTLGEAEECDDANNVDNDFCTNECTLPVCGDGIVQADEECDNGEANSDTEPNACRTDCRVAFCTDGVLDEGEECDDGNEEGGDGCSNLCRTPRCGDGFTDVDGTLVDPAVPEECDDGNTINDDNCSNECTLPVCGDGIVQGDEECDDENDVNDDGCSNNCLLPGCGDGILQPGEGCDDFNLEDGDGCSSDCRPDGCGDEVVGEGEECDDGNLDPTDGCTNACLLPVCGDRVVQGDEQCDDGNDSNLDACNPDCTFTTCGDGVINTPRIETEYIAPTVTNPFGATGRVCDDGQSCFDDVCDYSEAPDAPEHGICEALGADQTVQVVWGPDTAPGDTDTEMPHVYNWVCENFDCTASDNDFSTDNCGPSEMLVSITCLQANLEQCDNGDANADEPDVCRTNCLLPFCGDGIVDTGEECDDANDDDSDECTTGCTAPFCGDGIISLDEQCDDGDANADAADACRTSCETPICGDNIVDSGEQCDDGPEGSADCRPDCIIALCGNGTLDAGETCDDGNAESGDGCRFDCIIEECGNGFTDVDEQCDDGNDVDDDLCSNECALNGITEADENIGAITGSPVLEGTTAGAANNYNGGPECAGGESPEYVVGWVAPETGTYNINLCGSTYDTYLYVREATIDGTIPPFSGNPDHFPAGLACDDDDDGFEGEDCGLDSRVLIDAEAFSVYAIFVEGFGAGSGSFVLNIERVE